MNILTMILSLMFTTHAPKEPQGYLDCEFDARNVYVCRPESKHGNQ